jgi:hypothetical protein
MVKVCKLSEIKKSIIRNYNLYICSASFETRCLSVAKNVDSCIIGHTMLIYNSECLTYIKPNRDELENIFDNKSTLVEFRQSDPIFSADNIKMSLTELVTRGTGYSILLDITTFTHEILLILIRLFQIVCPNADIMCIYANASEYNSTSKNDEKWLSKGVGEIRSVLGYSGNMLPVQKTHLIVIVGYEFERAASIINTLEPNSLSLGYGRSTNATTEKNKEANEHYLNLVRQMAASYSDITQFEIKCDDPFETYNELTKQVSLKKDKNVLIVPLNNKISTLGVAFAAIKNSNIQLCYAPALIYNYINYSNPGTNCYIFNISNFINHSIGE